ncbi:MULTISPECIES: PG1828 family lipoprotein [Pedobacter]|jgi:hypothetical protein|uniref:Lipoprotein n=1 Tax=Pedobacter boryungensis TaxID=869962 RepID=A0ABX2DAC4_9SPHI|nr:hypothetical protein [Pedobacter boryungensis]NQX30534.1 hypothetical protein [Pedobacter boryungensis]
MKNLFKFGFLALALSLGVAACNSEKKADATDSAAIDSANMAVDSAKAAVDTAKAAVDSAKAAVDSTKAVH